MRERNPMSWELVPESEPPRRNGGGGAGGAGSEGREGRAGNASPMPVRSPRWMLAVVGMLVALLGVALLVWPFFAGSRILAFLVGAAFIGNGIAALVGSRSRGVGVPAGVLFIVLGLVAIFQPDFTVTVLVSFVAIGMLFIGGIWFLLAFRLRAQLGAVFVIAPAILFALGLAALIWPAFALTLAALAAGIVTLLIGGSLIWVSFALRRAR